jgi:hypothetical protein
MQYVRVHKPKACKLHYCGGALAPVKPERVKRMGVFGIRTGRGAAAALAALLGAAVDEAGYEAEHDHRCDGHGDADHSPI